MVKENTVEKLEAVITATMEGEVADMSIKDKDQTPMQIITKDLQPRGSSTQSNHRQRLSQHERSAYW